MYICNNNSDKPHVKLPGKDGSVRQSSDDAGVMRSCVTTERLIQSSGADFPDADTKLFGSIVLARPLPDDATVATLKGLFPGATEIAFPRQLLGARSVCVCVCVAFAFILS